MCYCPVRLQDSLIIEYRSKETISALDFLHIDSFQRKIVSQSITVGWVFPGVPI